MTSRIYETTFTVPAGTAIATPFTQGVILEDENLDLLTIIVPDGHAGLTGLRITWGGTQILPFGTGSWIIANNDRIDWPYDGEISETGLQLVGYNLDLFPHSFYLRWQISNLGAAGSPIVVESPQATPAAPADIAGITDLSGLVSVPDLTPPDLASVTP